jgi:glycosyltransferase involved in cell wall biosynthesis
LAELNLNQEKCRLHGALSDVKKEYQNGSLLVLPSRTEGFGLVLLEAMAFGIPVVAFDCGSGPSSIISDGENGFLVQPFDIRVFAERMMQLMEDDGLRRTMGNNGIQKARQYTIDKIGLQWKQLFDDLMQNGI